MSKIDISTAVLMVDVCGWDRENAIAYVHVVAEIDGDLYSMKIPIEDIQTQEEFDILDERMRRLNR